MGYTLNATCDALTAGGNPSSYLDNWAKMVTNGTGDCIDYSTKAANVSDIYIHIDGKNRVLYLFFFNFLQASYGDASDPNNAWTWQTCTGKKKKKKKKKEGKKKKKGKKKQKKQKIIVVPLVRLYKRSISRFTHSFFLFFRVWIFPILLS